MMSGMRSATIAVLVLLLVGPAWADEGPEHFHYLPPGFAPLEFTPKERAAFDHALRSSMYRKSCDCLVYLENGVVRKTRMPQNDDQRWPLLDRIQRGVVTPLDPHGDES